MILINIPSSNGCSFRVQGPKDGRAHGFWSRLWTVAASRAFHNALARALSVWAC